MKIFTKTVQYIMILGITLLFQSNLFAQVEGITYSFANNQITTSGADKFLEFDIMATATGNTQFKLGQVYIDYNPAGFGSSISGTTALEITEGALLANVNGPGGDIGTYSISSANNTASKLAIQNSWAKADLGGGDVGFDLTNTLGTTAQVYVHVKMKILDESQTSGISFDPTVTDFDQQQFYFTSGDNQTKYSPVNTGAALDVPLPVELQSFKATNQKGSSVELEWATATEVNNYGFEIERKVVKAADENEEAGTWEKVAFVEGSGNSNSQKIYNFVDKNPVGGTTFAYRLKQIDIDGTFEYSDEIEVKVLPSKYDLYQNYPNPFNPTTKIKFSLPENAKVKIAVYDILGRELTTLINKNIEAGYHSINFDAAQFTSGVYLYTIETSKFTKVKKMLLLK